MDIKVYSRYIFFGIFAIFLYLSYRVLKPYITITLTALIIAYLFYPLYRWLRIRFKRDSVSALTVILIIFLITAIPFVFFLKEFYGQAITTVQYLSEMSSEDILNIPCTTEGSICATLTSLKAVFPSINDYLAKVSVQLSNKVFDAIRYLSTGIINFFFVLFMVFFFLIDGPELIVWLRKSIPLKKKYEDNLAATLNDTTHAVVFGDIVTALIQGGIATIGYWLIAGFSNPIILGLATAFFALIPYGGTAIVWLPVSAYLFILGLFTDSGALMTRGIGLFLFGLLIVATIDNFIKPKIIGDRAKLHPLVVLIGVLGGLSFMGFVGIIIGPVILAVMLQLVQIFHAERRSL
jgi:predicted PurR-regulated permease PerM